MCNKLGFIKLTSFNKILRNYGGELAPYEGDKWPNKAYINKNMCKSFEAVLYFLTTCIGIEYKKKSQDVIDYRLEPKISVCMLVNFEFRILIWNFEF